MAGRLVAGTGQLVLALIGAGLFITWFVKLMAQFFEQMDNGQPSRSVGWIGQAGAAAFVLAWLWSLGTSLSLLREARAQEEQSPAQTASVTESDNLPE
jgi:hypothetical protein